MIVLLISTAMLCWGICSTFSYIFPDAEGKNIIFTMIWLSLCIIPSIFALVMELNYGS